MTAHNHAINVPGCYRCELSTDEVENYRIALRPDSDSDVLDDIVIRDVDMVHAEMMDAKSMHVAVYFPDDTDRLTLRVRACSNPLRLEVTAMELPTGEHFTYEEQP